MDLKAVGQRNRLEIDFELEFGRATDVEDQDEFLMLSLRLLLVFFYKYRN